MIGFNGGLIGKTRKTSQLSSVAGVWSAQEQLTAIRDAAWPFQFLPMSYAAFSLRPLFSSVPVTVARVRRSNDSAESDFTSVEITDGTLINWVGAGNNGYITTLYDQSPNNVNAVQTSTTKQPLIVISGVLQTINSKPAINITTAGMGLTVSGLGTKTRLDMFVVKETTDTQYLNFWNVTLDYSWVAQMPSSYSTRYSNFGAPTLYSNGAMISVTGRESIYTALNGYKLESTINASTSSWATFKMFDYGSYEMIGKVQEMIFYDSDISALRQGIEDKINQHYLIY